MFRSLSLLERGSKCPHHLRKTSFVYISESPRLPTLQRALACVSLLHRKLPRLQAGEIVGNMGESSPDASTLVGCSVKTESGASVEGVDSEVGVGAVDVDDEGDVGVGEGVEERNGHEVFAPSRGNSELLKWQVSEQQSPVRQTARDIEYSTVGTSALHQSLHCYSVTSSCHFIAFDSTGVGDGGVKARRS